MNAPLTTPHKLDEKRQHPGSYYKVLSRVVAPEVAFPWPPRDISVGEEVVSFAEYISMDMCSRFIEHVDCGVFQCSKKNKWINHYMAAYNFIGLLADLFVIIQVGAPCTRSCCIAFELSFQPGPMTLLV